MHFAFHIVKVIKEDVALYDLSIDAREWSPVCLCAADPLNSEAEAVSNLPHYKIIQSILGWIET